MKFRAYVYKLAANVGIVASAIIQMFLTKNVLYGVPMLVAGAFGLAGLLGLINLVYNFKHHVDDFDKSELRHEHFMSVMLLLSILTAVIANFVI